MKNCKTCDKEFEPLRGSKGIFCSLQCQQDLIYRNKVKNWLEGNDIGYTGPAYAIKNFIRKYLMILYNYQCSKCNWGEVNPFTNKTPLEVNHIDGNAANCLVSNLELICPNCHSLTPNFRNLNKGKSCRIR